MVRPQNNINDFINLLHHPFALSRHAEPIRDGPKLAGRSRLLQQRYPSLIGPVLSDVLATRQSAAYD
jgi:hypothetical protein